MAAGEVIAFFLGFHANSVFKSLMLFGCQTLQIAARLLRLIDVIDKFGQDFRAVRVQEQNAFFTLGVIQCGRLVGKNDRIAKHIVAQLRPSDSQVLL